MPTNRKRTFVKNTTRITNGHLFHLITGRSYFGGFGSIDEARTAWSDPRIRKRVYDRLALKNERFEKFGKKFRERPWAEVEFGK